MDKYEAQKEEEMKMELTPVGESYFYRLFRAHDEMEAVKLPPDWVNIGSVEYPFWVDAANVTLKYPSPKDDSDYRR